jgi:uncharacterized protein YgbK (DUF1537 family)
MIITSNIAGIIADDLTGANDAALQFHIKGAGTQILLSDEVEPENVKNTQVWAISTESRNISPGDAYEKVQRAVRMFVEKINPDYVYKKIDSTLRGNMAVEIAAILEILCWDAAVVVPAFPAEARMTIGGYHLCKGMPIERTEIARDPHSPISESHIPTLLRKQLPEDCAELVGSIELNTITKGAGPILMKLNELIEKGKKIIVVDAVSTVDIEQIALAINKTDYKILPTGASAFAQALSALWFADLENRHVPVTIPKLPKLVISGSATQITATQIDKLAHSEFDDVTMIDLDLKTILGGVKEELTAQAVKALGKNGTVVVNTSHLIINYNGFGDEYESLTKADLAGLITDFLADLTRRVIEQKQVILVTLGGETSYKCCMAIDADQLQLVDEVVHAIALSKSNAGWIVTKSGNLGGVNTLIDILKYLKSKEIDE